MTLDEGKQQIKQHFKANREKFYTEHEGQFFFADWYHEKYIVHGNYELYLLDVDDMLYDYLRILWAAERKRQCNLAKKRGEELCRIVKVVSRPSIRGVQCLV